jgi:hypothetical protein
VGLLFIPEVVYNVGEPCGVISTGVDYWFVHQTSLASYWQSSSSKAGVTAKEIVNFALQIICFVLWRVL